MFIHLFEIPLCFDLNIPKLQNALHIDFDLMRYYSVVIFRIDILDKDMQLTLQTKQYFCLLRKSSNILY